MRKLCGKRKFVLDKRDALIVVDVQRDFCPGGALPVPEGDRAVPILNEYIKMFSEAGAQVYATRDWHPPNHTSFKGYGGTWPPHCLRRSKGAAFHPKLRLPKSVMVISKATDVLREAYSGFDETELHEVLKEKGVRRVFVGGLATDYCVKNTVLDAIALGFETVLLLDATLGVNIRPDDSEHAINEMTTKGAKKATLHDIDISDR